jgi:hypothetical protein
MKIGGEYRLRNIGLRNWKKFAVDLHLQEDWLIGIRLSNAPCCTTGFGGALDS